MYIRRLMLLALCYAAVCSDSRDSSAQQDRSAITLQDIADAWRATENRVRSAEFHWTTQRWQREGAVAAAGQFPNRSDTPIPPHDVTSEIKRTLLFRDALMRFEAGTIYVWNGESATDFHPDDDKPQAFVYGMNQRLTDSVLAPFQFAFRMFDEQWYVFDPEKHEIVERDTMLDGLRCITVETHRDLVREKIARGRRPLKAVYWICPEQGFSIVHYAGVDEETGDRTGQFDIDYEFNPQSGVWVPTAWTITFYGADGPTEINTSTVEDYALNPTIADETFELELPPNTFVNDARTQESYILRANGEKRLVTRDEVFRDTNYEDWIETESGEAALRSSLRRDGVFSSKVTWIWVVGVVAAIIVVTIMVRRNAT